MRVNSIAVGGPDEDGYDEQSPVGVYACKQSFLDNADLASCQLAERSHLQEKSLGWITARESWSGDHAAEHFQMAMAAAETAGLLHATTLFDRFWVRYPTPNTFVASNFRSNVPPDVNSLLVAPTLEPTDWAHMETLQTRGMSLLELAQLPDFSHSVDDWLLGNEKCAVTGTEGAYDGISLVESCHSYEHTMGAVNVTHFAPMNREMYAYYHSLAKDRMRACGKLKPLVEDFYEHFDAPQSPIERPFSTHDTEAHDCERHAFLFEMIAQHFLQDAWSTGHMFKRWGYPNFSDFPRDVPLPFEDGTPLFEPENGPARRAALALLIAAYSGTIHGAKAVVYPQVKLRFGDQVGEWLEQRGNLDDPLSGPEFTSLLGGRQKTSFTSGGMLLPGAGDMFWNPPGDHGKVATDTLYDVQRNMLMACSAGSMREVYDMPDEHGNPVARAHGLPDEPLLPLLDPMSAACWDHWDTNATMLGAIGPVDLLRLFYDYGLGAVAVPASAVVLGAANRLIIDVRGGTTPSFPRGDIGDAPSPDEARLLADRDKFLNRVRTRTDLDYLALTTTYLENTTLDPDGSESARGVDQDGEQIRLLGIGFPETPSPPPAIPNVEYIDPPNNTLGQARRVFWRGDLENVCQESVANDASLIWDFRSKCIAGAAAGGDPDSCTACVDLAELHIPTCLRINPRDTFRSKCSAVGAESIDSPPAGLPTWWFNVQTRTESNTDCGYPSYLVALRWCSDTEGSSFDLVHMSTDTTWTGDDVGTLCGVSPSALSTRTRVGFANMEVNPSGHTQPSLRPMSNALEYHSTYSEANGFGCRVVEHRDLDARVEQAVSPAHLWDNQLLGVREVDGGYLDLATAKCGVTERFSWWNKDCLTALGQVGSDQSLVTTWDPRTGAGVDTLNLENSCLVREARRLQAHCPSGMTCTTGSQCVPAGFVPATRVVALDRD